MTAVPSDIESKADRIRSHFEAESQAIQSNPDLTPDASRRLISEAHASAKSDMKELRDSWRGSSNDAASKALADILKGGSYTSTDAISSRDAQDRAARLESQPDAIELLTRARLSGDDVLVGAIAAEAWRRSQTVFLGAGWLRVLDTYIDGDSVRASRVARLKEAGSQPNGEFDLQTTLLFSLPSLGWY